MFEQGNCAYCVTHNTLIYQTVQAALLGGPFNYFYVSNEFKNLKKYFENVNQIYLKLDLFKYI